MAKKASKAGARGGAQSGRAKKRPPRKPRVDWAPLWLAAFRRHRCVTTACKVVHKGRTTVYDRRKSDPAFAEEWDEIELQTDELLEASAVNRCIDGVVRPFVHNGKIVKDERGRTVYLTTFPETLTIFLLKTRMKDRYGQESEQQADATAAEKAAEIRAFLQAAEGVTKTEGTAPPESGEASDGES